MGFASAFTPCPKCQSSVRPDMMTSHLAWHDTLNSNFSLLKVLAPGLSITI